MNLRRLFLSFVYLFFFCFRFIFLFFLPSFFFLLTRVLIYPPTSDEAKTTYTISQSNMNNTAKWAIIIGGGILGVLILIGVIVILIKFFMKRCQKKAWDDISSLPKSIDTSTSSVSRKAPRRASTERELLHPTTPSDTLETPDIHVTIPIDENAQRQSDHTLVQVQRDRLNRLKEEENRLRPMMRLSSDEDDIQRAIDQAQKEFEESVINASAKLKRHEDN